jgi:hypothetical protein
MSTQHTSGSLRWSRELSSDSQGFGSQRTHSYKCVLLRHSAEGFNTLLILVSHVLEVLLACEHCMQYVTLLRLSSAWQSCAWQ